MHRRQYLPLSHLKLSRRQLRRQIEQEREQTAALAEELSAQTKLRHAAEQNTIAAKARAAMNTVKRFMTRPISFGRRAAS